MHWEHQIHLSPPKAKRTAAHQEQDNYCIKAWLEGKEWDGATISQ